MIALPRSSATMGFAVPATGQIKGPVAPALTPEQIALSKSMAAKLDEAAAKEQRRLETFKDRPLAAVIQRSFDIYTNYLALAAEMMPESGYDFRPTPELRTFGEQINHATSTQYSFCNQTGAAAGRRAAEPCPDRRRRRRPPSSRPSSSRRRTATGCWRRRRSPG